MSEETSAQNPAAVPPASDPAIPAPPAAPEGSGAPVNTVPPAYGAPVAPPAYGAPAAAQPQPVAPGAVAPGVQLPAAPAVPLPPENVLRGFLLSLVVVPVGIAIWLVVWNLGYIASIVALVIAFGAYFLYKKGSGGRISIRGALLVALVTVATIVLAFFAGQVSDVVTRISRSTGASWFEVLGWQGLGGEVVQTLTSPSFAPVVLGDAGMTALFGVIGCVGVIVTAFREAKAQRDADVAAARTPQVPPAPSA